MLYFLIPVAFVSLSDINRRKLIPSSSASFHFSFRSTPIESGIRRQLKVLHKVMRLVPSTLPDGVFYALEDIGVKRVTPIAVVLASANRKLAFYLHKSFRRASERRKIVSEQSNYAFYTRYYVYMYIIIRLFNVCGSMYLHCLAHYLFFQTKINAFQ